MRSYFEGTDLRLRTSTVTAQGKGRCPGICSTVVTPRQTYQQSAHTMAKTAQPASPSPPWSAASRAAAAAIWRAPECNWDLGLFAVLLAFSVFSDLTAVDDRVESQDLRQLPGAGRRDGLPRRHPGGADRRGDDPHRLAALARRAGTTCSTTSSPTRCSPWSAASPSTRLTGRRPDQPTTRPSTSASSPSSRSPWRSTS